MITSCTAFYRFFKQLDASKLFGCITKVKVNNSGLVWFLLGHSCKSWVANPMDMDVLSCIKTVKLVKRERISRPHKSITSQCIAGLFYNHHHYILSYIDQKFCCYLVILSQNILFPEFLSRLFEIQVQYFPMTPKTAVSALYSHLCKALFNMLIRGKKLCDFAV